jgi:PEP-CTERM motif-containing protein
VRLFIGSVVGVMALCVAAGALWPIRSPISHEASTSDGAPAPDNILASPDISAAESSHGASPRRVYRYSVVPGGVYSPEEVEAAIRGDQVVAAHYAAIEPRALHTERLAADRLVYMSYRVGDAIYWTKQQVRLPKGELVLTDGVNQLRARCGNCISLVPQLPTSDNEPAQEAFNTPVDTAPEVIAARVPFPSPTRAPIGELPPSRRFPEPTAVGSFPPGAVGNIPYGVPIFGTTPGNPSNDISTVLPDFPVPPPASLVPSVHGGPTSPGLPPTNGFPRDYPFGPPSNFGDPDGVDDPGGPDDPSDPPFDDPFLHPSEQPVPVPEPGTLLLVGGGISAVIARRFRKTGA